MIESIASESIALGRDEGELTVVRRGYHPNWVTVADLNPNRVCVER